MIYSIAVWNAPNCTSLGVWLKVIEGPHVLTDESAELLWSKVISPGFSPKADVSILLLPLQSLPLSKGGVLCHYPLDSNNLQSPFSLETKVKIIAYYRPKHRT